VLKPFDYSGEHTARLTVHMSPELRDALVRASQAKGVSIGSWWRGVVREELKRQGISL